MEQVSTPTPAHQFDIGERSRAEAEEYLKGLDFPITRFAMHSAQAQLQREADNRILFDVARMAEGLREYFTFPRLAVWPLESGREARTTRGKTQTEQRSDNTENTFQFEGAAWRLRYVGKTVQMPNLLGLHYISVLVQSPNQWIEALALRLKFADAPCDDIVTETRKKGPKEPRTERTLDPSLSLSDGRRASGVISDEQERQEIRTEIARLDREIGFATARNDLAEVERLQDEKGTYLGFLKSVTGIGGRSRRFPDDASRAGQSVARNIRYALKKIRSKHPLLADHLQPSIDFGVRLRYSSDHSLHWIT